MRDAALIAIVGIGLGLSYNKALLLAHDDRALTWVAKERSTGVLDLATPAVAGDAATPAASAAPSADASAPAPSTAPATSTEGKPATTSSTTQPAAHDTTHAQKSSAKKSSAKKSTKTATGITTAKTTPTSASPAHGPIETSEGGAKSAAPASSAPAAGGVSNPAATAAGGAAVANAPAIPDTREPLEANYAVIKALHDANGAVFLDARSADDYAAGHIPGAISMPFDDVFKKPEMAKFDDKGKPIVTYCDGGDCELSKDLAFSLIDNGHKKVVFFKDGLPGWKSAGNPVNTGSQP